MFYVLKALNVSMDLFGDLGTHHLQGFTPWLSDNINIMRKNLFYKHLIVIDY